MIKRRLFYLVLFSCLNFPTSLLTVKICRFCLLNELVRYIKCSNAKIKRRKNSINSTTIFYISGTLERETKFYESKYIITRDVLHVCLFLWSIKVKVNFVFDEVRQKFTEEIDNWTSASTVPGAP